jgi:hypothetical protein
MSPALWVRANANNLLQRVILFVWLPCPDLPRCARRPLVYN